MSRRAPLMAAGVYQSDVTRSAMRELCGHHGSRERLVVCADVVEGAGIPTVAHHLVAQLVAALVHGFHELSRDELLEQARLDVRSGILGVHGKNVARVALQ